jgi:tripartite-type tricarboxylate transporter receptor subunit TctC
VPIVVYRGTAPAANDVVGGHVPMMIEAILALLPLVKAGSVRAVAVTGQKRSALAPDVPTTAELGLPALDFGAWWAMWGPPGLPAVLTQALNGWVNEAVKALAEEGRLAQLGIEPAGQTSEAFAKFVKADFERSEKILRAAIFSHSDAGADSQKYCPCRSTVDATPRLSKCAASHASQCSRPSPKR